MMNTIPQEDRESNYQALVYAVKDQLENERDIIANLSNISAYINELMDGVNWAGFYILREGELVVGPFQGKPACVRIQVGRGVCGTAVQERRVVVVEDVHAFQGHIACDADSNSEIVLPIFRRGEIYGVLDIDSPEIGRFTQMEEGYLMQVAGLIGNFLSDDEASDA